MFIVMLLFAAFGAGGLLGQGASVPVGAPVADKAPEPKAMTALRALRASIDTRKEEIEAKRADLSEAETDAQREEIKARIGVLSGQLKELEASYESIITGIDLNAYSSELGERLDLAREVEKFLQPIFRELNELTSRPREIDALREAITHNEERLKQASRAVEQIREMERQVSDPLIREDIEHYGERWMKEKREAENDLRVARFQLEDKLKGAPPVLKALQEAMASFFATRGRNLLFSLLVFVGVLAGMHLIHRYVKRWDFLNKLGKHQVYLRLADVVYYFGTFVLATLAALLVLYAAADWLLLGLALLFLFGLAWGGKRALPHIYQQARFMLNLGSVREGERVVFNGAPWRVDAINVFTKMSNPLLQGGNLRLPLRELMKLQSRPFGAKEPWFPTENGDWVVLSDSTFGRVVMQTPEWVQLVLLGGSRKIYGTPEFISLTPENLSYNFRVRVVFGVDYQHQSISTATIPETLAKTLRTGLLEFIEEEELIHLDVELREAGSSSLDYAVLADFAGSAAPRYEKLRRRIQRICVDACNANGWVIPFTQITVHQAGEG